VIVGEGSSNVSRRIEINTILSYKLKLVKKASAASVGSIKKARTFNLGLKVSS